ncbi:hypothetical protein SCLCIDRAFT_1212524 [Scleroderma citrinum Foug A]|uniref:Uncharacterized protein n=1 Tax=Scleroderma citrinum Foug A TaxID=1036808 RepID=A0A0C3AK76_9AGAM|nr:hypothetical protein SCLCIDRAFT_1212524 [Scleroderma citrinum Foug A]
MSSSVVVTVLTIFLCICRLRFLLPAVFMASVYNEALLHCGPVRNARVQIAAPSLC